MNSYSINDIITIIGEIDIKHNTPMTYINETLREYTHNIKLEINPLLDLWEKNKKYSNPYEFINTNYDTTNMAVCTYKPISRAFFKMIEILNNYNFLFNENIKSFHLAEGPGGFIEALKYIRNNDNDIYYGMTLMEGNRDVPKWDKSTHFLNKSRNVIIEKGIDMTGNLYNIENLEYVYKKYKHSMDFITGDGGFDFSIDFNKQEENSLNLIVAEIFFAIVLQKKGGSFVLKVFDTFSSLSVQILYLLCYLYENVYITKPLPSRPANSERYIVCLNFKMVPNIEKLIQNIFNKFYLIKQNNITSIINNEISNSFLEKINEVNAIFGQSQIENIMNILTFIQDKNKNEKQEILKKSYLNKCVKWCKKYNLPIHDLYLSI
jgi:23S rRNA U2552 (ribose-2'-O)-methylase RlmE/FtsJ